MPYLSEIDGQSLLGLARKAVVEAVTRKELPDTIPQEGVFGERAGVVAAGEHEREFDIFNHGERGEELEGLENESNFIAAEFREGGVVERRGLDAIERDGARGGKIHGAGEV